MPKNMWNSYTSALVEDVNITLYDEHIADKYVLAGLVFKVCV